MTAGALRPLDIERRDRTRATAIGMLAVPMWALLAPLTTATGRIPPFELLALTFAIGGGCVAATWPIRGVRISRLRISARGWAIGVGGLFGYHFLYYTALRNAPPANASLIAYLWPTLIVLGAAMLPGGSLRWFHVAGCLCGFAGAAALLAGGDEQPAENLFLGYASAFGCAIVWAAYSLLSRMQRQIPTDAVALFCLVTAALALVCHLLLEPTVLPASQSQWLAVAALGLLPAGLAFFAWDYGVKHGDIRLLGIGAYFAPVLSTMILVAAGMAPATGRIALACALVVAGAVIATRPWRGASSNPDSDADRQPAG